MFVLGAVLTVYGGAGAAVAAVREAPRFLRWYLRVTSL